MSSQTIGSFRKHFTKGEVVIREGEQDSQILLPEQGVLDIFVHGRKVNSIDASVSQDFIGEIGAILNVPRTATVVAATDCVAICLPKIELEAVMKNAPSLGVKLVRSLCKKLVNSTTAFAEFQVNSSSLLCSGNTEISLKNYIKGLLYLVEQAAADRGGEECKKLLDYFVQTNPWGICTGDSTQILPTGTRHPEEKSK